mmetsp:Transcript_767/g.2149  ORF Transcript_767/g.2149 Transcript_767/m.2149 type:complete len:209 (-) Transcript_767:123-749(-)
MVSNNRAHSFVVLAIVAALASPALSFAPSHRHGGVATRHPTTTSSAGPVITSDAPSRYDIMKLLAESEDGEGSGASTADEPKLSLEEKMKSWEASEEEIKAASLGGITAGSKGGTDGFDVGLWVMASLTIISHVCSRNFYFLFCRFEHQPLYFANNTYPTAPYLQTWYNFLSTTLQFPFIVATSLLFFVFPFIKDSIDVSSVGPPPMV